MCSLFSFEIERWIMQAWIAVLGTALGAIIALAATFGNEALKYRRELGKTLREERREVYARYLAAVTEAHEDMRAIVRRGLAEPEEVARLVEEKFTESRVYRHRYELAITAGQEVLDAAEGLFQQVRDLRDSLAKEQSLENKSYATLRKEYGRLHRKLQLAIREELGLSQVGVAGGS
jgi:hypothetical protein